MIIMILITGCDLTMLSVLRPTGPAGRIPLGPCSNTAPSDLLVDHSQPPKRLVDSNTMTCKKEGQNTMVIETDTANVSWISNLSSAVSQSLNKRIRNKGLGYERVCMCVYTLHCNLKCNHVTLPFLLKNSKYFFFFFFLLFLESWDVFCLQVMFSPLQPREFCRGNRKLPVPQSLLQGLQLFSWAVCKKTNKKKQNNFFKFNRAQNLLFYISCKKTSAPKWQGNNVPRGCYQYVCRCRLPMHIHISIHLTLFFFQ